MALWKPHHDIARHKKNYAPKSFSKRVANLLIFALWIVKSNSRLYFDESKQDGEGS